MLSHFVFIPERFWSKTLKQNPKTRHFIQWIKYLRRVRFNQTTSNWCNFAHWKWDWGETSISAPVECVELNEAWCTGQLKLILYTHSFKYLYAPDSQRDRFSFTFKQKLSLTIIAACLTSTVCRSKNTKVSKVYGLNQMNRCSESLLIKVV